MLFQGTHALLLAQSSSSIPHWPGRFPNTAPSHVIPNLFSRLYLFVFVFVLRGPTTFQYQECFNMSWEHPAPRGVSHSHQMHLPQRALFWSHTWTGLFLKLLCTQFHECWAAALVYNHCCSTYQPGKRKVKTTSASLLCQAEAGYKGVMGQHLI